MWGMSLGYASGACLWGICIGYRYWVVIWGLPTFVPDACATQNPMLCSLMWRFRFESRTPIAEVSGKTSTSLDYLFWRGGQRGF